MYHHMDTLLKKGLENHGPCTKSSSPLFFVVLKNRDENTLDPMIMASGPIISWQIEGEKVETVTDFIFLGSKITADGDCSHEIKRHLLLGRKAMTNLDSILKSRERPHFANKGPYSQSYDFFQ